MYGRYHEQSPRISNPDGVRELLASAIETVSKAIKENEDEIVGLTNLMKDNYEPNKYQTYFEAKGMLKAIKRKQAIFRKVLGELNGIKRNC